MALEDFFNSLKGGAGSGNFSHSGRPGKRGGSSSGVFANSNKNINESLRLKDEYGAVPKECWKNSILLMSTIPGAVYVEGYFATKISPELTFPIAHGWLEKDGDIIDVTLPKDKGNYYAAAKYSMGDIDKALGDGEVTLPLTSSRDSNMREAQALSHQEAFGIDIKDM